ncbi:MAG: MFS transporter [Parachlamydiales bacterium]|nr:MFS transporter [Parachlamydiales bacterium]
MEKEFLSKDRCKKVLNYLYLSRLLDDKMNKLVKQNKGTTFYLSNAGHDLIGILSAMSLDPKKDYSFPYYRDRAYVLALGSSVFDLIGSFLARNSKHHSSGRMMPDHFCDNSLNIACQSSCVGSQYLQAVGLAKVLKDDQIVYVSGGEGSTSQGDFHEALNFSSIYKLPVFFCIQDNDFAISVSKEEQIAGKSIAKVATGFENLKIFEVDGTDYLETSKKLAEAIAHLRQKKGPVLFIAKVPRINAHSNSDDQKKYKSEELIEKERKNDPVLKFEKFLLENKILSDEEIKIFKTTAFELIEKEAENAEKLDHPKKSSAQEKLFNPFDIEEKIEVGSGDEITMMDALNHALKEEMENDENVVVFGEDVAKGKGGVFGITRGLSEKFGNDRCFNSPLAESTIIGMATGMTFDNKTKPVIEIQFADYAWSGINQLVNELASIYYRSNGEYNCPVVVRMPFGGYIQGGPYHSQSIESHLCHVPGLKVVIPSNASDAKMLLKTAIKDPNPVVFLEHKAIYRQMNFVARKEPSKDSYLLFGKANIVRKGSDVTVVCYGMMVMFVNEIAKKLEDEDISIEIIDLRTLVPLDKETIINSVKKTSKLLILHEDKKFCGFGAEISSIIMEEAFEYLDAPVKRVAALDIPIPYSKILEDAYFPQKDEIEEEIKKLVRF